MKLQFVSIVSLVIIFSSCTKEVIPSRHFSIHELSHGGLVLDSDSDQLSMLQQLGVPISMEIEAVTPRHAYAPEYFDNIITYRYSGLVAYFYQSNYNVRIGLTDVEISSDELLEVYGFHVGMPQEDILRMYGEEDYEHHENGIASYSFYNYVNLEGVREDCMGYPIITFRFGREGLESVSWSVVRG
ncbi:MAG: hypothetical protein KAH31_09325 [Candidatus Sabulitectum sp.]|nr:hypothetical protein [Candidatus Sabulitectum sp.]